MARMPSRRRWMRHRKRSLHQPTQKRPRIHRWKSDVKRKRRPHPKFYCIQRKKRFLRKGSSKIILLKNGLGLGGEVVRRRWYPKQGTEDACVYICVVDGWRHRYFSSEWRQRRGTDPRSSHLENGVHVGGRRVMPVDAPHRQFDIPSGVKVGAVNQTPSLFFNREPVLFNFVVDEKSTGSATTTIGAIRRLSR